MKQAFIKNLAPASVLAGGYHLAKKIGNVAGDISAQQESTELTEANVTDFMKRYGGHIMGAGALGLAAMNRSGVAAAQSAATSNLKKIDTNTAGIKTNTGQIATNTAGVKTNAGQIATNTAGVKTNADGISDVSDRVGVNSHNIGTAFSKINANTEGLNDIKYNIGHYYSSIAKNLAGVHENTILKVDRLVEEAAAVKSKKKEKEAKTHPAVTALQLGIIGASGAKIYGHLHS